MYKSGRPVCCIGHYTRSCHEFLLLGARGRITQFRRAKNLTQLVDTDYHTTADSEHTIVAQRSSHSSKPIEAYELIEEFFTCDRKIELFARDTRNGFDSWGLELDGYFIKDAKADPPKHNCCCRVGKRRRTEDESNSYMEDGDSR